VYFFADISPRSMFTISLKLAALCGYASWTFVERGILRRVHRRPVARVIVPSA
jgi:hypothetical protein